MLELINVSKRYGDLTAIKPTTWKLQPETTYVLLGTSGCGKSTLLKLALGLVQPDSGCIRFDGTELSAKNIILFRQRVGYVIQSGGLFPHLTAAQNASLVAKHLGWQRERIERRMTELADLTQLPRDVFRRYPAQLSGGQQQRVSLMRALFLDPDLLLMDEPLGALDPVIRSDLQADLREIFRSLKKTVVIVTHDLHEAAYFADEILMLRDGEVLQRGTIDSLLDQPADPFVTKFINAQRTELPGGRS